MDTYSDANSAPPEIPEQSRGSSVSSRLQDEYEELLRYAVVVPKIDVDDLPRILADSKRSLTKQRIHTPSEHIHTSDSESNTSDLKLPKVSEFSKARNPLGKIISPPRRNPNKESDIQTITPKTKVSPSDFRYKYATQSLQSEESESESEMFFDKTVQSEMERAPSETDLKEIEKKLNHWTRDLNSNIMDEISRLRIKLLETARHQLSVTESRHAGELNVLRNELEGLKELLHTYEVSIERKDGVIANLTRSLQNQKEKFDNLKAFTEWKIQFALKKQEGYAMRLSAQHHNLVLKRRCWKMWHSIIVEKWRRRVEKACQAKAQEVCIALTNDYETKLKSLDEKYTASREEVMSLHRERDKYEENMKKAFMRGVCALNMEAMNMFQEPDPSSVPDPVTATFARSHNDDVGEVTSKAHTSASYSSQSKAYHMPSPSKSYTVQHEPAYITPVSNVLHRGDGQASKTKRISAVVTAKPTVGKPSTAQLMNTRNVLVERHDNSSSTAVEDVRSSMTSGSLISQSKFNVPKQTLGARVVKIVP